MFLQGITHLLERYKLAAQGNPFSHDSTKRSESGLNRHHAWMLLTASFPNSQKHLITHL